MLTRILEPEVMDTAEEARDYDTMDHSAVNRVFVDSSNHMGTVETSLLASFTSPMFTAVFGGVVTLAVAIIARQRFRELRDLKTLVKS